MTTNPTDRAARIAEIADRHEKATPGPWTATIHDYTMADIHSTSPDIWAADMSPVISVGPCNACANHEKKRAEQEGRQPEWQWGRCTCPSKEDFDFIVHARADIPYLLSALSTADAERREMVGLDDHWDAVRRAYVDGLRDAIRSAEPDAPTDDLDEAGYDYVTKLRQAADRTDGGRG